MKPKHTPPRTSAPSKPDPRFKLLALNLLIESQGSNVLPQDFLNWVRAHLVDEDTHLTELHFDRKRAA